MNPLTLVKRIQSINSKEASLGISEEASWHAKYRDSAYVFVGGIPYDLTEGDLLAVFAQYGEVVDVNLIRDKGTGKSKGFAFLAYEDQRSTTLAVDNLNGAQILGRIIRVDHCSKYVKKEEEDEEVAQQKREARGVCRAFQRGECTRGDSCKFSHDEQRAANTGWGHEEDKGPKWGHDMFAGAKKSEKRYTGQEDFRSGDKERNYRGKDSRSALEGHRKESSRREETKLSRRDEDIETDFKSRESHDGRQDQRVTRHNDHEVEPRARDESNRREEKRLTRHDGHEYDSWSRDDRDQKEEKRSRHINDEFRLKSGDDTVRREEKRLRRDEDDGNYRSEEQKSRRHDSHELEPRSRRDRDSREERGSRRQSETSVRRDQDKGAGSKRPTHDRVPSYHCDGEREDRRRERDR